MASNRICSQISGLGNGCQINLEELRSLEDKGSEEKPDRRILFQHVPSLLPSGPDRRGGLIDDVDCQAGAGPAKLTTGQQLQDLSLFLSTIRLEL